MLFNSAIFLFLFLPVVWLGFRLAVRAGGPRVGAAWLMLGSLWYYGWWSPPGTQWTPLFLGLLLLSLVVNYNLGRLIIAAPGRRGWLLLGLAWNLGLLGYFKYRHFFLVNIGAEAGGFSLGGVALPLGISFFTFQIIAFLVDAWRGRIASVNPLDFFLFILFFPQLIAGPIVHHGEFIPQVRRPDFGRLSGRRCAIGLAVFSAGLFQKCVVADTVAPIVNSAFGLAANGTHLRLQEAWVALIAYSVQLLNDFSGYSHMALGLGLLFGLRLPVNFLAPYTAGSLIEFWRRWHITLSHFLRDYVYIPLGGNRRRLLFNLLVTMLLAGLWHGAGWTFILWGAWHGLAICINHVWRARRQVPKEARSPLWAHGLTLLVVISGWTLFRAADFATAASIAGSLIGLNGISVPVSLTPWVASLAPFVRPRGLFPNITAHPVMLIMLVAAAVLACAGPRLLRFFGVTPADVVSTAGWQNKELAPEGSTVPWTRFLLAGLLFALSVAMLARTSPFLYYQF